MDRCRGRAVGARWVAEHVLNEIACVLVTWAKWASQLRLERYFARPVRSRSLEAAKPVLCLVASKRQRDSIVLKRAHRGVIALGIGDDRVVAAEGPKTKGFNDAQFLVGCQD